MEKQFSLDFNGQQVQQQDFATLGEASGLADDRVLAELFRLAPYDGTTVARGILPYVYSGVSGQIGTVAPNGATGTVKVYPFRAVIGSRTAVGTEARKNWRDVRSGLSVAEGATTGATTLSLAANSSGNPRWDAIVATVAVDADGPSTTRKVKDATTRVVSDQSVTTYLVTTVSLSVITGTPGASPAFPATPSDSAGNYYIVLAYVRVPTGFSAGSTVAKKNIDLVAPVLTISTATGGLNLRVASGNSKPTGAGLSSSGTSSRNGALKWTGTDGQLPGVYMPPTMAGGEQVIGAIDAADASSANWSHQDGDIVDDSIDWRNRLFEWTVGIGSNNSGVSYDMPWQNGQTMFGVSGAGQSENGNVAAAGGLSTQRGIGHSFLAISGKRTFLLLQAGGAANTATPAAGANVATNAMASGTSVSLYVDDATGALKVHISGTPKIAIVFWVKASGQYVNL